MCLKCRCTAYEVTSWLLRSSRMHDRSLGLNPKTKVRSKASHKYLASIQPLYLDLNPRKGSMIWTKLMQNSFSSGMNVGIVEFIPRVQDGIGMYKAGPKLGYHIMGTREMDKNIPVYQPYTHLYSCACQRRISLSHLINTIIHRRSFPELMLEFCGAGMDLSSPSKRMVDAIS